MAEKTIYFSNPSNIEKLYDKAKNEVFPHLRTTCRALSSEFFEQMSMGSKEYEVDFDTNKALYYFVRHFKELVPEETLNNDLQLSLDELAKQVSTTDVYTQNEDFDQDQHQPF